jgi:solute carrier family 25 iron transporter 28/37
MLKQRTQLAPNGLTHPSALLRYIVKNEGFLSLYRGYPITLLMNVPQAAVIVCVNESLKVLYKPKNGHNVFSYFFCAAVAGSAAALATIPLDNVKTRLQTQTFFQDSRRDLEKSRPSLENKRVSPKLGLINMAAKSFFAPKSTFATVRENPLNVAEPQLKYRDIMSTMKTIFREEGVRGFVKGVFPRILAQAPASAISWTVYEMMKKMMKNSKMPY